MISDAFRKKIMACEKKSLYLLMAPTLLNKRQAHLTAQSIKSIEWQFFSAQRRAEQQSKQALV
jgi:competence protein ComGF